MANITTYPFASQCAKYGADLVWTPMVHTDTVINNWEEAEKIINFEHPDCHFDRVERAEKSLGQTRSLDKLEMTKKEGISNYIIQLVGSDPSKFTEAIIMIERNGLKPLGFDLNAGCPDKNIVKSGCGGALLKNPDKIMEILRAMKTATNHGVPISVKTRAGFDNTSDIYFLVPRLIDAGISMITIHPRTVKQGYTGTADWGVVRRVKELLSETDCTVVGSGDVKTWEEAIGKQKETKCDGVMIGRGALGRPWIFKEVRDNRDLEVGDETIKKLALDLADKSDAIWGDHGILEARKHFAWYFRGFDGAKELRTNLMNAENLDEVRKILED